MTRDLASVVHKIKHLSLIDDPETTAREAYHNVLVMLSGVDDVDIERLIEATKGVSK